MGRLVTATSMAWLIKLYPAKMAIIRKVIVWYRSHQEDVDRYATRSVHDLALIHPTDELNLIEELGKVTSVANNEYEERDI